MTTSDLNAVISIYREFEKRKALKKVKLSVLLGYKNKKWFEFWKI
jgi:hypothetical protein